MAELGNRTQWWIATGPLERRGTKKRLGPFVSRELAETVRGYIEQLEGHKRLWICVEETRR